MVSHKLPSVPVLSLVTPLTLYLMSTSSAWGENIRRERKEQNKRNLLSSKIKKWNFIIKKKENDVWPVRWCGRCCGSQRAEGGQLPEWTGSVLHWTACDLHLLWQAYSSNFRRDSLWFRIIQTDYFFLSHTHHFLSKDQLLHTLDYNNSSQHQPHQPETRERRLSRAG